MKGVIVSAYLCANIHARFARSIFFMSLLLLSLLSLLMLLHIVSWMLLVVIFASMLSAHCWLSFLLVFHVVSWSLSWEVNLLHLLMKVLWSVSVDMCGWCCFFNENCHPITFIDVQTPFWTLPHLVDSPEYSHRQFIWLSPPLPDLRKVHFWL